MKRLAIAAAATAILALGACDRGNQDQLNTVETNTTESEDLNALADQAANVASEAQVLENQAQELNNEAQATDSATGAETPEDENIAGM